MNMKSLLKQYSANEKKNAHSENLLLLANLFGNEEEKREALLQAESKRNMDAKDYRMPDAIAWSINDYYYKHLIVDRLYGRLEEWAENTRPNPSADRLRGRSPTMEQAAGCMSYEERVNELEAEGLTRSDAQGVVDAEDKAEETS
jgi:hypothetical protein